MMEEENCERYSRGMVQEQVFCIGREIGSGLSTTGLKRTDLRVRQDFVREQAVLEKDGFDSSASGERANLKSDEIQRV